MSPACARSAVAPRSCSSTTGPCPSTGPTWTSGWRRSSTSRSAARATAPRKEPADDRTRADESDPDLRSRDRVAVLQRAPRVPDHGHRPLAVPRVPGGGGGRATAARGPARRDRFGGTGDDHPRRDPRGGGGALRLELPAVAAG